jgi:hypothetical protein
MKNINNNIITLSDGKKIKTKEGKKVLEECILFLKN